VIPFPIGPQMNFRARLPNSTSDRVAVETPSSDEMERKGRALDRLSKYPCTFDYGIYRKLETRFSGRPIRGGIVMKTAFRLVNSHATCQQSLYAFEVDTYGRGCLRSTIETNRHCKCVCVIECEYGGFRNHRWK